MQLLSYDDKTCTINCMTSSLIVFVAADIIDKIIDMIIEPTNK